MLTFLLYFTAVHTIAHWYNYERFVAFNPPTSVTEFGLDEGAFVPDESTVVVGESTVSYYRVHIYFWMTICIHENFDNWGIFENKVSKYLSNNNSYSVGISCFIYENIVFKIFDSCNFLKIFCLKITMYAYSMSEKQVLIHIKGSATSYHKELLSISLDRLRLFLF